MRSRTRLRDRGQGSREHRGQDLGLEEARIEPVGAKDGSLRFAARQEYVAQASEGGHAGPLDVVEQLEGAAHCVPVECVVGLLESAVPPEPVSLSALGNYPASLLTSVKRDQGAHRISERLRGFELPRKLGNGSESGEIRHLRHGCSAMPHFGRRSLKRFDVEIAQAARSARHELLAKPREQSESGDAQRIKRKRVCGGAFERVAVAASDPSQ